MRQFGSSDRIGFSALLAVVVATILAGAATACTGSKQTLTTTTETVSVAQMSTTTVPATTTTQPHPGELLIEVLGSERFSADIQVSVETTQPGAEFVATGSGVVSQTGSSYLLVTDMTGLDSTFIDTNGRIVGLGGRQVLSQASLVVDGVQYRQDDGGHWHVLDVPLPATALEHVFDQIALVESFVVVDETIVDGEAVSVLVPADPITYDLGFFDVDPATVDAHESTTEIDVDAAGIPTEVRIRVAALGDLIGGTVWDIKYELSNVGSASPVETPDQHWVAISSLGFEIYEGAPKLLDLEVPADWNLTSSDSEVLQFDTPGGAVVTVLTVVDDRSGLGNSLMRDLLESAGVKADVVEESMFGVYPARFASALVEDVSLSMAYTEVQNDQLGLAVFWSGPPFMAELQRADFEEVLRTVSWEDDMGPDVVPGRTIANTELQTDTRDLLRQTVSVTPDINCESPTVVWTDVAGSEQTTGIEEWYVNLCGERTVVYTISFVPSSVGGTDVMVDAEPLDLDALATQYRAPISDAKAVAEALWDLPWLVENGEASDRFAIASVVSEARFRGGRISVAVLDEAPEGDIAEFADAVLSRLGRGTVLVIGPDEFAYASDNDIYTDAQLQRALNRASGSPTDSAIVTRFVHFLIGD